MLAPHPPGEKLLFETLRQLPTHTVQQVESFKLRCIHRGFRDIRSEEARHQNSMYRISRHVVVQSNSSVLNREVLPVGGREYTHGKRRVSESWSDVSGHKRNHCCKHQRTQPMQLTSARAPAHYAERTSRTPS